LHPHQERITNQFEDYRDIYKAESTTQAPGCAPSVLDIHHHLLEAGKIENCFAMKIKYVYRELNCVYLFLAAKQALHSPVLPPPTSLPP
jgi:hypothetical protein